MLIFIKAVMKDKKQSDELSLKLNIAGIALFLLLCAAVTYFSWPYISDFIQTPDAFPEFVSENVLTSIFLYLAMQILQVVVALIPGEFLEVGAGLAFGWFGGLLMAQLGVALGTILIFIIFRKLGKPLIMRYLGKDKIEKFEKLNKNPKRDSIIFFVFLVPGLPKDLLTYAAAFFDISIGRFLALTLIARIPSIVTSTYAGKSIIDGDLLTAAVIFVITGIIAFIASIKIRQS